MILSFVTLTSVLLMAAPSWAVLTKDEFQYIMKMCFDIDETSGNLKEPLGINGQVNPLAQTLENFIALAEKYETANPHTSLKEELFYFIRNYTYDNFEYTGGRIAVWSDLKDANYDYVSKLWEPEDSQRKRWPDGKDPFSDAEKCSIFYMMSHSIIRKNWTTDVQRAATNSTSSETGVMDRPKRYSVHRTIELKEQYPQEVGVVSVRGTNVGVTLGKVLTGMYVGLNENRKKKLNEVKTDLEGHEKQDSIVDPLYILTLAEVIALASWIPESRDLLAGDGHWVSVPIGNELETKDVCPMIYKLDQTINSLHSYSSARGAADGFILGRIVSSIERRNRNTRLSQILRMYYSRGGISERDSELGQMWVSFCNRQSVLQPLETTLKDQVLLYRLLVSTGTSDANVHQDKAWAYYQGKKNDIFGYGMGDIRDYCGRSLTVEKPEDLPLESPLDVIAVIDTSSGKENIERQQLILGYLARAMDLSHSGSRITVLTDQKVSADANGKIQLVSIVSDNPSAACVACSVTQFDAENTPMAPKAPVDEVIIALDQLLQAKKENETKHHGVSGKVVIYFNFKDDEPPARNSQTQRVDTALRDLHLRHQDTAMYALGRTPESVKKFARDDMSFVMSAVDEAENIVGKKLFEKISLAPATLQYENCADGKGENSAIYEDFVSPNSIQHWKMPAEYFLKSREYKFTFDSQYGPVRVCHSRATFSPELQKSSCKDVTNGQPAEFRNSNPCKGFNVVSCAPFYFSIMGINNTAPDAKQEYCSDTNTENQCRTLDQIKFKVTHEGIRCSGSIGLVSTPLLLVIGIIIFKIFTNKY